MRSFRGCPISAGGRDGRHVPEVRRHRRRQRSVPAVWRGHHALPGLAREASAWPPGSCPSSGDGADGGTAAEHRRGRARAAIGQRGTSARAVHGLGGRALRHPCRQCAADVAHARRLLLLGQGQGAGVRALRDRLRR